MNKQSNNMTIAIVGGGVTGLAVGYFLSNSGFNVTIFEKGERLGGIAGSFKVHGNYLDKYYRHLFLGQNEIIKIIRDLGLGENLTFTDTKMGFFRDGRLFPFNTAIDLIRFKPLNILDRLKVGFSGLVLLRFKDWHKMDKMTASEILKKYSGRNGYKAVWEPLLRNKFGKYHEDISATWLWDRVNSRSKSKSKSGSKEVLGYLDGSFKSLFDKLTMEIEKNKGSVLLGSPVSKIIIENNLCSGIRCGDRTYKFSKYIVTLPIPHFLGIATGLPVNYSKRLKDIQYCHSICLILRLRESLSSFYWINIGNSSIPFAVIVEHTNMIPSCKYKNEHIVYLSQYLAQDEYRAFNAPDDVIFNEYSKQLKNIFPHYKESMVINYHVFRDKFTQPIFQRGYSRLKPDHYTPIKNLLLANTSQVYPESRSMNTSFKLAADIQKILELELNKNA